MIKNIANSLLPYFAGDKQFDEWSDDFEATDCDELDEWSD